MVSEKAKSNLKKRMRKPKNFVFLETDWKKSLASLSHFKVIKSEDPPFKSKRIVPREGELPDIKNADMGMRYLKKVEFEHNQVVFIF